MDLVVSIALVLVSAIHLAPSVGVLGPDALRKLYRFESDDPNLVLLMRHRAVLFGLVGVLLLVAAWVPELRVAGLLVGATSVVSFLVLGANQELNDEVRRVMTVDWIALVLLVIGGCAWLAEVV